MNIVIAGGSGYIGTQLSKKLLSLGHRVVIIDIMPPSFVNSELFFINHNIEKNELPYGVLEKSDAVINLAGRSIAAKWTPAVMDQIKNSRINSTKNIIETIKNTNNKPSCFICASAIGFYGDIRDSLCDEKCPRGEGFLAEVVYNWENVAKEAELYGVRTVCIRTAPVLGSGGFLTQITKTARFGFLLKLKKQDFWMSWIHIDDIVNAYVFAIETTTLQGIFNASSPEALSHSSFMKKLSKAINRRIIGTLPKFLVKKMFGLFFDEITKSQRVIPQKLIDKGFSFQYPTLESALRQIYKNYEKN